MAMSKARSTACKVACAWLLTALVIQNTFQNGVYIPVSAEEQDDTTLQEWGDSINTLADNWLSAYVSNASNAEWVATYGATVIAATAWKASYDTQMQFRENAIAVGNSAIPAGGFRFGWFYYGNQPYSGTIFMYGQNGDRVEVPHTNDGIVAFSSDLFTVKFLVRNNLTDYNYFVASYGGSSSSTSIWDVAFNFNGAGIDYYRIVPSDILTAWDQSSSSIYIQSVSSSKVNLQVDASARRYFNPGSNPSYPILGTLDNLGSFESQVMLSATPNTPQDISDSIYNTLLPDYPAIEDIYFPAGGADVPDMSGFDFPPDLPAVSFNAPEMPSQSLPEGMLSGAGFWFTQFGNLLDGLGVKYIVIIIMIAVLLLSILKF